MKNIREIKQILVAFSIVVILSIPFLSTNLDINIQQKFYDGSWFLKSRQPWHYLYNYGAIPAIIITVASLIVFVGSYFKKQLFKWRKIGAYFLLAMILGPGIFVNAILKDHWGRPRPRNIIQFDGKMKYLGLWEKGIAGGGKSFPCGHASMGFYLFAPMLLFRNKKRYLFLALGIFYGGIIGVARIVQGGHFASDVIWAAFFVYLAMILLFYGMRLNKSIFMRNEAPLFRKRHLWLPTTLLAIFLVNVPYYKIKTTVINKDKLKKANANKVIIEVIDADVTIEQGDSLFLEWTAQGNAFLGGKVKQKTSTEIIDSTLVFAYSQKKKGLFTRFNQNINIVVPYNANDEYTIKQKKGSMRFKKTKTTRQNIKFWNIEASNKVKKYID